MNLFLSMFLEAAPAAGGGMVQTLIMMGLLIVVFYFFMIRPQMKRQKELRKFREGLKKGDKIVTTGGIYGTVAEVKDDCFIIEIADNVKIKIDKSAVVIDMADANRR
jgi:preprotein translocase subunit YajC